MAPIKSASFGHFCPEIGCALDTFDLVLYMPIEGFGHYWKVPAALTKFKTLGRMRLTNIQSRKPFNAPAMRSMHNLSAVGVCGKTR